MLNKEREERVIQLTQKLIQKRSYSGEEKNVAKELEKFFQENGFTDTYIDEYGNIIGHIKGNEEGKKILFDGHMDTVPVTDEKEWKYPPFKAEIHEGKIYGRGSTDMKGAVAAMAIAATNFLEDTKGDFAGDIYIAGVVHEECFEGIASREISRKIDPDLVVIGEPSNLDIKIGQKGRAEIKLEVFGKPSHSSNPEKGINAVYKMMELLREIKKIPISHDEILGDGILELTDIKSSPYPGASVVPEYCMATYDRRLLVGETKESVLKPLQDLIDKMMKEDPQLKAKVSYSVGEDKCYTGKTIKGERFFPAWSYDKNDGFIQDIYKGLHKINLRPNISKYYFCTNGSHYAGEKNIKTVGFGPSKENLPHTVNEYIEIEQLVNAMKGYYAIIQSTL